MRSVLYLFPEKSALPALFVNAIKNRLLVVLHKISTNVTRLDCHLSMSTSLTFATMMLTVQTQKDLTTAHA